jgi:hypothetical protein
MKIQKDAYCVHDFARKINVSRITLFVHLRDGFYRLLKSVEKSFCLSIRIVLANRIDTELAVEVRSMILSVGATWSGPALMLGNKM